MEHDLHLTPTNPAEPFDIAIPLGDAQLDPARTGTQVIPFFRSVSKTSKWSGVREQVNAVTAYLDGSQVYGSDAERALELRTLDGTGRLKTSAGNLLPVDDTGSFVAGDIRVNEHAGLICMHTVFLREHNTWADRIREDHPELSDEQIYLRARAIVGAEIQAITYNEFLPLLLGHDIMATYGRSVYHPGKDLTIMNESWRS